MALCKTVNFKGIAVNEAYIRVSQYQGNKQQLNFTVTYHKDADTEAFDVKTFETEFDLSGANPLIQAYAFLKLQPDFAGAIDLDPD
ncbi:hypothetical protein [Rheinheimera sp. 1928-s]|uniref:hypothetical protein n=1 Tax=Rheinheimera sp. 1928-s TaxID=3033803 RepID=UPI00262C52F8|nr:hypothetical protein [Rheinheimera sp. 1928-s]MDF3127388.1 hypothetical protein [Rheinheimera sp. 1928-s]